MLALAIVAISLTALCGWRLRQLRLQVGAADLADLAILTGVTDPAALARAITGGLAGGRLDRAAAERLPIHPATRLLDAEHGHGLCLAVGLAGLALILQHDQPPPGILVLMGVALIYQGIGRLWRLALVLELREARTDAARGDDG